MNALVKTLLLLLLTQKRERKRLPPAQENAGNRGRSGWEEGKLPNERVQFAPHPLLANAYMHVLYSNGQTKVALFETTDIEIDRVKRSSSRQQTRL